MQNSIDYEHEQAKAIQQMHKRWLWVAIVFAVVGVLTLLYFGPNIRAKMAPVDENTTTPPLVENTVSASEPGSVSQETNKVRRVSFTIRPKLGRDPGNTNVSVVK